MSSPDRCHREPEVAQSMRAVRAKAARVCGGTDADTAVVLAGSGTAALEAAVASVVPPDGRLLILDNGHYGERIFRIASVHRIPLIRLEFGWMRPFDLGEVDRVLSEDPSITHVAMIHHETSTGMLNPLRAAGELVARHGRALIVDAISSLGSERLDLAADHITWCVGTANKCLEGLPGVSFVVGSHAAFDALGEVPARGFYLDLHGHYHSQEHLNAPMFTPAVQVLTAFEKALDFALEEGPEARGRRYDALAQAVRSGFGARGGSFLLPAGRRANSVTNIAVPEGLTYQQLHDALKDEGFVVYSTQDKLAGWFRVATMGQLVPADIEAFFEAYDRVVAKLAAPGERYLPEEER
jgi:2-aminoethylphosphonate-pyruvate transaminase